MTRIKINYSLATLRAEREKLARVQYKEYTTRGNTERCQELFKKIERLDAEIEKRLKEV